jgi:predicted Zn-dependent protease
VSEPGAVLLPAVHSAVEELRRAHVRFEVFARVGESVHLRRHVDGSWERRRSREIGVSCRAAGAGCTGFAACSGSSARAGREAARATLATMLPGPDPLPPREALGCLPLPRRPRPSTAAELEERAQAFQDAFIGWDDSLRLVDLRLVEGFSSSLLTTGEGFSCLAEGGGVVVEALLAAAVGPLRHVHWAARTAHALRPERLVRPVAEAVLAVARGGRVRRGLADVVLTPPVAARLVAALALAAGSGRLAGARGRGGARRAGGEEWHIVDERADAAALLPLPCDGEGVPVRRIELIAGGRPREHWSTWAQAAATGVPAAGAVRASYQEEPHAGPANLLVLAAQRHPREKVLALLDRGFVLDFPDGEVQVVGDAFALRAAAFAIANGRMSGTHPIVELRGSFRRLLQALAAVGDDDCSFSHECTITTPSLLLRGLEIA